jgi:hypothetical protein
MNAEERRPNEQTVNVLVEIVLIYPESASRKVAVENAL